MGAKSRVVGFLQAVGHPTVSAAVGFRSREQSKLFSFSEYHVYPAYALIGLNSLSMALAVAHTLGQESLDSLSAPGILSPLMLACEERGSEGTLAGVVWLNPALTQAALVWGQVIVLSACIEQLTWILKRQKMSWNTACTDASIVLRNAFFSEENWVGTIRSSMPSPSTGIFPSSLFCHLLFSLLYMTWSYRDM